ncbi:MAG TPA: DUF177 domain-containing protein [Bacillota bacterium]|nr:DUF177 domain-containing protein [Bacillota bacterium]
MVSLLRLDVARLKKSPGESGRFYLRAELPPVELSGDRMSFSGPVGVSVVVTSTGSALAVDGKASGRMILNCSRCLEHFEHVFEVPVQETYVQSGGGMEEEAVVFNGDFIDIGPEVIKSVLMSLPMKAVCREDCPGLCPGCGSNLNECGCGGAGRDTDPRLSILKELLQDGQ